MPANAVYVGRPTRLGNPFRPGCHARLGGGHWAYILGAEYEPGLTTLATREECVEWYRRLIESGWRNDALAEIRGKDLACWCPLDKPCHADVLLEIANKVTDEALDCPAGEEREFFKGKGQV